jgi:hypothetical protein
VQIHKDSRTCYGQVEDAGPVIHDDVDYVLGTARNTVANWAAMDVSSAFTSR